MTISLLGRKYDFDEDSLEDVVRTMRHTSRELCARLIPADQAASARKMLDFALFEFLKNCLHGSEIEVYEVPLRDGSILLIAHDLIGDDHLDPDLCGHLGVSAITAIVGTSNYHVVDDGSRYSAFLRINPNEIAAKF